MIDSTNIAWLMQKVGIDSYEALHAWSITNREAYWEQAIERLGVRFQRPPSRVADFSIGVETPRWLMDARLNIVESCFSGARRFPGDHSIKRKGVKSGR